MTNTLPPSALASNQQLAAAQGKIGFGKVVSALGCAWLASYFMNQASLHGVDFTAAFPGVTVSSEVMKSSIEAGLEALIVYLTPQHFIAAIVDTIRWFKRAYRQIADAINNPTN